MGKVHRLLSKDKGRLSTKAGHFNVSKNISSMQQRYIDEAG